MEVEVEFEVDVEVDVSFLILDDDVDDDEATAVMPPPQAVTRLAFCLSILKTGCCELTGGARLELAARKGVLGVELIR